MKIDHALVSKLEDLTRLTLSDSEREALRKDLSAMLDMVEKLNELNQDNVPPLEYPGFSVQEARTDEAGAPMKAEDALGPAPDAEHPWFRVPKVIKKKS